MTWVPFIERTDEDSCETCNGYGGLLDDDEIDMDGMPVTMSCPDCSGEESE